MAKTTDHGACQEPIAVIGSGCRFPGGANTPSRLWELLKAPRDLLTKIPTDRFNADAFYHPDGSHHGLSNVLHSYCLEEDPRAFDASFFNITPNEADSVDPQHRLLLETVYESLCTAGLKMEDLQGSPTAVYVGLMINDYADILAYDLDTAPTYMATGSSPCILSNRVSYFFDWHGPSMTFDTACSSSLVAVHQAVQCLRSGDSKVAVAAGANLIFSPLTYIVESKLSMLSPHGRSRMWDAAGDGYARGEGVAAVVLKTLSQALQDGDPIECIIRETGVNQDGRSAGITMPSHVMQEQLIRQTYAKAGLDINKVTDRCQYFEAHGPGTPAGDPQEAEAISSAFFGDRKRAPGEEHLYVGSVKTVIGHTEGTAGVAGLLKASLALQHGIIPPNMLFENLNPNVAPFYQDVRIVTEPKLWPQLAPGVPRRASVNSFGFGGTNAHAIIENYEPREERKASAGEHWPSMMPVVLSANSERALKASMENLLEFLTSEPATNMHDLAWTLLQDRSVLQVRRALTGQTVSAACTALEQEIGAMASNPGLVVKSDHKKRKPDILGIFTGQGAQWPAMGKVLIQSVAFARHVIDELDSSLATLPSEYRPSWTLVEQLMLEGKASNVTDATFSQPLCTAVQILLVKLLTAAGITFKAIIGHSSGEIACAYAAGYVTAAQAIRIAYLRGFASKLASSPRGADGTMLAAGTTFDDAQDLCALDMFAGRLCAAASNAPDSVTLSGDVDAIQQVQLVLEDESKFARRLKVDKAYHSHHMLPCADSYVRALTECGCATGQSTETRSTVWLSSVYRGHQMTPQDVTANYWKDNLVSPVLFSPAVKLALDQHSPLEAVIEVGCHAALKGPCLTTIQSCIGAELPYTGCMQRGADDIDAFATALCYLWERFGAGAMDVKSFHSLISPNMPIHSLAKQLPRYAWDHHKTYWFSSRSVRAFLHRDLVPHPLLGNLSAHSTAATLQWHNFIRPRDITWLDGHQLQDQIVFPGAGYVVMAMEAVRHVAGDRPIQLVEVLDLKIGKAITFDDENSLVEVNLTLDRVSEPETVESVIFRFHCDSCLAKENNLSWSAGGRVVLTYGPSSTNALPPAQEEAPHMIKVNVDKFYHELAAVGYGYSKGFRGLTNIKRVSDRSCGAITMPSDEADTGSLMLHPTTLDLAFQALMAAFSAPGDGRLRALQVPTAIGRIAVNPTLSMRAQESLGEVLFHSTISNDQGTSMNGEVDVFLPGDRSMMVQIEQIGFQPFSPPTAADDGILFSHWVWGPLKPDAVLNDPVRRATDTDREVARDLERMVHYYLHTFLDSLSADERDLLAVHSQHYIRWAEHVVKTATDGQHAFYQPSWDTDTLQDIQLLRQRHAHRADVRLLARVGEQLQQPTHDPEAVWDALNHDGLLIEYYETCLGCPPAHHHLGQLVGQIIHRHPNMDILEIGAGTGGATKKVLQVANGAFNSYVFTDISSGFFEQARGAFDKYEDRMDFLPLDITRPVVPQGFPEQHYDLIIAANALHATAHLESTLRHVRSLLKPGGHLVFLEHTNPRSNHISFVFGLFPDWWAGVDEGRTLAPVIAVHQWDALLQQTGFSSIDSRTADKDANVFALSVFSARAIDNRITMLDRPLSVARKELPPPVVVVGGGTARSSAILTGLQQALPDRKFHVFAGWQHLDDSIELKSTFVVLSELDEELFAHLQEDTFEGVQTMFFSAKNILWLTEDAWTTHPYQAMVIGMLRALRLENAEMNIQSLDVDGAEKVNGRLLAEQVLRLEAEPGSLPDGILWTTEPELRWADGHLWIPRLQADTPRNHRYNSSRRTITAAVDISDALVSLQQKDDMWYFQTEEHHVTRPVGVVERVQIRVHYSLPYAVRVGNRGCFYLVQGQLLGSDDMVLALSEINASCVDVPRNRTTPVITPHPREPCLLTVAAELLARSMVSTAASGTSLLVLEPYSFMVPALLRRADQQGCMVKLAGIETPQPGSSDHWIHLHPQATQRVLEAAIPTKMSTFFDLSQDHGPVSVVRRLMDCLPTSCTKYRPNYLVQDTAVSWCDEDDTLARILLENAVQATSQIHIECDTIPAAQLVTKDGHVDLSTVIDWRGNQSVQVRTQPLDSTDLFGSDKTYLLVGLTGDLGRSLCRWMILHGARHIVLTSRNPKVDPRWIEEMADLGATVKLQSMNVIDKASVVSGLASIQTTMPAIGGIAFGPLVLQDALFENMDLDTMELVLDPKVAGARNLDELFFDADLDFFVMFSSLIMVGGNAGQSNYAAANAYLCAVAAQRRHRGLAASCLNLGAMAGVGILATTAREEDYHISKYMYTPLSEQDLHTHFAESVVAGRAAGRHAVELTTGMPYMDPVHREHLPFFDDPRLGHYKLPDQQKKSSTGADSSIRPVRERLLEARTIEEAHRAIQDGLTEKLRTALAIPADEVVDVDTPLIDQGVDSLVAVAIRTWFSKQLELDLPVLKVLGGASIVDLVDDAVQRLHPSRVPLLQAAREAEVDVVQATASTTAPQPGPDPSQNSPDSRSESPPSTAGKYTSEDEDLINNRLDLATPLTAVSVSDAGEEQNDPKVTSSVTASVQRQEIMSYGQARFWRMNQLVPDPTTFNVTIGLWMHGALDLTRLSMAVQTAFQRHETFRTRFEESGSPEKPKQTIMRTSTVRLENIPVTDRAAALERFKQLEKHVYNLATGETARVVNFHWSPTDHFIVIAYHQIVSDGWSYEVLFNEIAKIYDGETLPVPPQYADFAIRQRQEVESGQMDDDIAYWTTEYNTLPAVMPILPLALTSTRFRPVAWESYDASRRLPPMLGARIKDRSRKHKAQPLHFYLAAYHVLLARLSNSTDLSIGLSDANRASGDDLTTLGHYLNFLPLRLAYSSDHTFGEAIGQARNKVREAQIHSKLPFEVLLQRLSLPGATTTAHTPLFQAAFDYKQGQAESGTLGPAIMTDVEMSRSRTAYNVVLEVVDDATRDPKVTFKLQSSLYGPNDAEVLLKSYLNILSTFSRNPALKVEEAKLVARGDVDHAVKVGRGPAAETTGHSTVLARILSGAGAMPEDVALRGGAVDVSYAEMARKVNDIAAALIHHGVSAGAKIVSMQSPSSDWVCSMLAVMKIGAIYVPIDLSSSQAHLSAILDDCKPTVILTNDITSVHNLVSDVRMELFDVTRTTHTNEESPILAVADQPAVLLYIPDITSGTPKAHMQSHTSLLTTINALLSLLGDLSHHTLQQTALTSHTSITQALLGLTSTGSVSIVPEEHRGDPLKISQLIAEQKVSCTLATPGEYTSWIQYDTKSLKQASSWKHALIASSESLSHSLLREFCTLDLDQLRVFNTYTAPEIGLCTHAIEIPYRDTEKAAERIPVGTTTAGYVTYILDENLHGLPVGWPGKILIGGPGVSGEGKRFIPDTFASEDQQALGWKMLFHTGHRGRLRADGVLLLDGGMD